MNSSCSWYSLELPCQDGSDEYSQRMRLMEIEGMFSPDYQQIRTFATFPKNINKVILQGSKSSN